MHISETKLLALKWEIYSGVCIFQVSALCFIPGPSPYSWPSICIYRPQPPICIYRLWPRISIFRPSTSTLLPVWGPSLHIPTLSPRFVFVFAALEYDLYYRSGAWICSYLIIGSSNSSSSSFFGIDNTNIFMPVLVIYGKQTEACTHTGCKVDLVYNQMNMFLAFIWNRKRLAKTK